MSGLAGCSGVLDGERTATLTPVSVPPTETTTPTRVFPPETAPACRTDTDAARQPRPSRRPDPPSFAAGLDCPTIEWATRTVCHHAEDAASEDVLLVTTDERAFVGNYLGDSVAVALLNDASAAVRIRPDAWTVLGRRNEGDWRPVVSGEPGCTRFVETGAAHHWRLGINTSTSTPETNVTGAGVSLDPGLYLLAIGVAFPDAQPLACVAPFAIRAYDPVALDD